MVWLARSQSTPIYFVIPATALHKKPIWKFVLHNPRHAHIRTLSVLKGCSQAIQQVQGSCCTELGMLIRFPCALLLEVKPLYESCWMSFRCLICGYKNRCLKKKKLNIPQVDLFTIMSILHRKGIKLFQGY